MIVLLFTIKQALGLVGGYQQANFNINSGQISRHFGNPPLNWYISFTIKRQRCDKIVNSRLFCKRKTTLSHSQHEIGWYNVYSVP